MNRIDDVTLAELIGPYPDARVTGITLSRRNLETLLAKLDTPGSKATLYREVSPATFEFQRQIVVVKAEEDADHYYSEARQEAQRGWRGATVEDGATAPGIAIAAVPGFTPPQVWQDPPCMIDPAQHPASMSNAERKLLARKMRQEDGGW